MIHNRVRVTVHVRDRVPFAVRTFYPHTPRPVQLLQSYKH